MLPAGMGVAVFNYGIGDPRSIFVELWNLSLEINWYGKRSEI